MKNRIIEITSVEALSDFAESIAKELSGGEVLLLSGELGAGKTTFVKKLVEALGSDEIVTSPTFVLRNDYTISDKMLFHIDLYRLKRASVEAFEFFDSVGDANTITCIEWPERVTDPETIHGKKIELSFVITGDSTRELNLVMQ